MNNVCRALAQTSVRAANTLRPSMLAARLSFTLRSRPTPSKHITKAEITFGNMILQPLPYNTRPHQAYAYTNTSVASHFSTTVSSLLLWSLPSLCQWVYWRHHPQSWRNFDSTPANVLLPIATSDLAVSRVKCHLTALSIYCRFVLSLSFAFAVIFNGTNTKVGIYAKTN